eukprot:COSAG01_NODE_10521_length_2144_cov_4.710513_3_plen_194_part_00
MGAVVASRPAQTVQFFAQLMKKKCGVVADLADSFSKKTSCWQRNFARALKTPLVQPSTDFGQKQVAQKRTLCFACVANQLTGKMGPGEEFDVADPQKDMNFMDVLHKSSWAIADSGNLKVHLKNTQVRDMPAHSLCIPPMACVACHGHCSPPATCAAHQPVCGMCASPASLWHVRPACLPASFAAFVTCDSRM